MVEMPGGCPIWKTPAQVSGMGDSLAVDSPRAGGRYRISGTALELIDGLSPTQKGCLTWWLVEQRSQGDTEPFISSDVLDTITALPLPSIVDRRDRALDFLASRSPRIGARIRFFGSVDDEATENLSGLLAWTGSAEKAEAIAFLEYLTASGYITGPDPNSRYQITFSGWTYLEEQRAKRSASEQAFIAMWFDSSMTDAYALGFKRAIVDCGYAPMRIDGKEHINKIDDEIVAEIRRSRFVVADFTSQRDQPRGGVYFEAGFAMGLNIPVIWTCRSDLIDQVHFDTRQFNHIVWSDPDDLYVKLKNRIGAVIGDGPLLADR